MASTSSDANTSRITSPSVSAYNNRAGNVGSRGKQRQRPSDYDAHQSDIATPLESGDESFRPIVIRFSQNEIDPPLYIGPRESVNAIINQVSRHGLS